MARRQVLETAVLAAAAVATTPASALAGKVPKGFSAYQDRNDGYQFLYPFGWQEIAVQGQDVVFKDVVEPLESVSVSYILTDSASIDEFGPSETVAETLARQVLTPPTQPVELLKAEVRSTNGQKYLEFEFLVEAPRYKRHSMAVVTVANGKFFTLTTGANERRWNKMQEKLKAMVHSFQMIDYTTASYM